MTNNAKSEYFCIEIINCQGKISSTWQAIEDMIHSKKKKKKKKKKKSNTYAFDNLKDKAEKFNNFSGVGETTSNLSQQPLGDHSVIIIPHNDSDIETRLLFRSQLVDINTVILTIKRFNKTRSFGSDSITLRFLQDALYVMASYMTCINYQHLPCIRSISHSMEASRNYPCI